MTKALRKAIMLRTQLRNRLKKNSNLENWKAFKKQRNKCVKILHQVKASYYGNVDMYSVTDKKKFCRVQKKSRLHGCELEEDFLNLCQF